MSGHVRHALAAPAHHTPTPAAPPHLAAPGAPGAPPAAAPAPGPAPPAALVPVTPASSSHHPAAPHRIDTHHIKQQLHDALGEAGLPYWKALNAYLLGQVGRDELAALVRTWLKGKNLLLHNQLLYSLLHNASSQHASHAPASPLNMHKRPRDDANAPDFDSDATFIESRQRVIHWILGMGGKERSRIRKAEAGFIENGDAAPVPGEPDHDPGGWDAGARKRKWSAFVQSEDALPPLSQSEGMVPSSNQLASRLAQSAKSWGLDVAPESARDIGEFLGVGLNAQLGDVLHSVVQLTGRERPGAETIRVPPGSTPEARVQHAEMYNDEDRRGALPPPKLDTLQYLFALAPGLHPTESPLLFKLASGLAAADLEFSTPPNPDKERDRDHPPSMLLQASPAQPPSAILHTTPAQQPSVLPLIPGMPGLPPVPSPAKAAVNIHAAAGQHKMDAVSTALQNTGLLKLDKAGRGDGDPPDGERKRDKKHNLHWKYEDPAHILKDILG